MGKAALNSPPLAEIQITYPLILSAVMGTIAIRARRQTILDLAPAGEITPTELLFMRQTLKKLYLPLAQFYSVSFRVKRWKEKQPDISE
tara:strand:- start:1106 stop:1372 length:267 start_codon:yes stop_codon:yes gene_type:complete